MSDFGKTLHNLLRSRGMSQSELAVKANLTTAAVSHYVHDSRIPQLDALSRMADALDVSVQELMGQPTCSPECETLQDAVRLVIANADQLGNREKYDLMLAITGLDPR